MRRGLKIAGWTLLGLVLALYIGLPTVMAIVAVWPSHDEVGAPPAGFEKVETATSDGLTLAGWWSPPRNGATVVLVHGAGSSRDGVRRQAMLLAERGYGVLAIDLRGHGESGGRVNRLGWEGTRDIEAAVAFLKRQPGVRAIGGVGSSMGGEVLLGASAAVPELRAIVADGATRRSTAELTALPSERPLVRSFTARVMYAAVRVFSGQRPPAPLLDEMRRAPETRYLLIAAGDNELETAFNEYFAQQIGRRAELWVAPGVEHTGALTRYPEEYEQRLIGFLDEALLQ